MRKIIFLGGMFSSPYDENFVLRNSRGGVQSSANNFQNSIIDGLRSITDTEVVLMSAVFVGAFPFRFKLPIIKGEFSDNTKNIGFVNLPVVKHISRYFSVKSALDDYMKGHTDKGDDIYILIYSAHVPFIKAVSKIKLKYGDRRVHIHNIVPDLPEYMNFSKNYIYKLLKFFDIKALNKYKKYIDSFTFLTRYMSDRYNPYNKPYVVVEGVADSFDYTEEITNSIVYTGGLNRQYGVMELIESIDKINSNYNLVLCGDGDLVSYIKSLKNNRIRYLGVLPREQILRLQAGAKMLVNPRNNTSEYTKYSFPSKIMEYLRSKRPTLCYKLDGIPNEYEDVLIYIKGGVSNAINNILDKDEKELKGIGAKAFEFSKTKLGRSQAQKIFNLILKVERDEE